MPGEHDAEKKTGNKGEKILKKGIVAENIPLFAKPCKTVYLGGTQCKIGQKRGVQQAFHAGSPFYRFSACII